MRETILKELQKIERQHHVRILHAAESGSRAWGFASPDSDYDVRFIYVRPMADYLRLDAPRDVIEWKLDEVLDINGWDLNKALRQIGQSNANLFEWSNSPIVYESASEWDRVCDVSRNYFSERAAINHYYGTAASTLAKYLNGNTVRYKKYLYALRPLLAARYIEMHHKQPPVLFSDLLKMDIEPALRSAIGSLLDAKRNTTESEEFPHIPEIQAFIRNDVARQKAIAAELPDDRNPDWKPLNNVFVDILTQGKE